MDLILIDENTTKTEMKEFYNEAKALGEEATLDKWDAKELLETPDLLDYMKKITNDRGDQVVIFKHYGKHYNIIVKKQSSNEYQLECFEF